MSTVVLVRPGCTDFDEQNRIQGSLDLPLNDRGREQLQQIVDLLRDVPVEAVYTAPNEPALCTARAIGDSLGIPVKQKEHLRNLDQGLWQGLPVDEIRRKYPKVFKQWQESPETICPPEGEMVSSALQRIEKVLKRPLKKKACFAVVASEPLASLVCSLLKKERPEFASPTCGCHREGLIQILESGHLPGNGAVGSDATTAVADTESAS